MLTPHVALCINYLYAVVVYDMLSISFKQTQTVKVTWLKIMFSEVSKINNSVYNI